MTPEFQELLDCARDILKQEAHVLEWPHYLRLREAVTRVEQAAMTQYNPLKEDHNADRI